MERRMVLKQLEEEGVKEVNSFTPVELGEGDLYTQATFIAIAEVL